MPLIYGRIALQASQRKHGRTAGLAKLKPDRSGGRNRSLCMRASSFAVMYCWPVRTAFPVGACAATEQDRIVKHTFPEWVSDADKAPKCGRLLVFVANILIWCCCTVLGLLIAKSMQDVGAPWGYSPYYRRRLRPPGSRCQPQRHTSLISKALQQCWGMLCVFKERREVQQRSSSCSLATCTSPPPHACKRKIPRAILAAYTPCRGDKVRVCCQWHAGAHQAAIWPWSTVHKLSYRTASCSA